MSSNEIKNLTTKIKEADEDFEFYPSAREMIQVVSDDIKTITNGYHVNMLDIMDVGCGNGNALYLLEDCMNNSNDEYGNKKNTNIYLKKFGIEKSKILIENMKEDIIIVGCDFEFNTLIDKKMDYIFCNPPYSKYEEWVIKLIKESNCKGLYLIIPQRWKENENILKCLKDRCNYDPSVDRLNNVEILGSFDFLDSEYRIARAKVDVIKIKFQYHKSAFDTWFDEHFDFKTNERKLPKDDECDDDNNSIILGKNLIERLVELYNNELNILLENYKKFQEIDSSLLSELGVDKDIIKMGLEKKISGLKNKYWNELFENLDKITNRLTTKYRKIILDKLMKTTSIDINIDNVYSVVIWVIKNSNIYQDEQLLEVYKSMTEPKNIKLYKSNIHFVADSWRHQFKQDVSKYQLDYRLVFECGMNSGQWNYDNINGISKTGFNFINDIFTIAKTLGMNLNNTDLKTRQWEFGKQNVFLDDEGNIFAEMRPYKNGNLHAKLNKNFILRFNIEAGKLNGWIKDTKHAAEEMEIKEKEIVRYFDIHKKIDFTNKQNLKLLIIKE